MSGCKPSNRWADKKALTLNVTLTTEMNNVRRHSTQAQVHRSDSDSYESPTGEEDPEITSADYKSRNQ